MSTAKDWVSLMEEHFPMESADGTARLTFVPKGSGVVDGSLRAVLRIIIFEDTGDGQKMVRDVKEQWVFAGEPEELDDLDRYAEFLRALKTAFGETTKGAAEAAMPRELYPADALGLQAETYDEFGRALSAKSRLGEYMKT